MKFIDFLGTLMLIIFLFLAACLGVYAMAEVGRYMIEGAGL